MLKGLALGLTSQVGGDVTEVCTEASELAPLSLPCSFLSEGEMWAASSSCACLHCLPASFSLVPDTLPVLPYLNPWALAAEDC